MKRLIIIVTIVLFASTSFAAVLTFDDITNQVTGNVLLAAPYGGFNWTSVGYFHKDYATANYPTSNYANGVYSGNYATYNSGGAQAVVSNSPFTFNGAYFTSAWSNQNMLTVTGYLSNVQLYQTTVQLDLVPTQYFAFNFSGIDKLTFDSSNLQFVMDDFTYNASVPEPATMLLLGLGLMGLAGVRRKIRK